jgi:hypothetical protein
MHKLRILITVPFSISIIIGCTEKAPVQPNLSPEIFSIVTSTVLTDYRLPVVLFCVAYDFEFDPLSYLWSCTSGNFLGGATNDTVVWQGAKPSGTDTLTFTIAAEVTDGHSNTRDSLQIKAVNGDLYYDTGEPFVDAPDTYGLYNGVWDAGEVFFDLPSSRSNPAVGDSLYEFPTLNGSYDNTNGYFDEYELFTRPGDISIDPTWPILYTYNVYSHGADWQTNFWLYDTLHSTWTDRNSDGLFEPPW